MEKMHRTQIMLEDSQYLTLRERARLEGKSMGQLIRELVDRGLRRGPEDTGLGGLGIDDG